MCGVIGRGEGYILCGTGKSCLCCDCWICFKTAFPTVKEPSMSVINLMIENRGIWQIVQFHISESKCNNALIVKKLHV